MELKRLYNRDADGKPTTLRGVKVLHAGEKQKFSDNNLLQGMAQGWLKMEKGHITVTGEDGDVVYKVVREPGYYCCHCKKRLEGDPRVVADQIDNASRKAHVAKEHKGKKSPDPENPSGYMGTTTYKGVRV